MSKQSIFIELTISDNCNCNCKYCFEGKHPFVKPNIEVQQRQLQLLVDACEKFNSEKFQYLTISFWGGEPFMDVHFIDQIISATYKYSFVRYHCYSNGTLTEEYKQFLSKDYISSIYNRMHIQLSYDGEPHHTLKRGNNSAKIFEVADMLLDKKIDFSFKATLSFDLIEYLPQIWDSYKQLYDKYGSRVSYYPTLDTTESSKEYFQIWKTVLKEVAKKEFSFIQKYHRPLFGWFSSNNRRVNCALENSIQMHSDGNIYICHGCAYKKDNDNFKLGNITNINSLYEVLNDKLHTNMLPAKCIACSATHCQVCHIENIAPNQNPYDEWINCRVNNINRCNYFKEFGYISTLLQFAIIKGIYNERQM